MAETENPHPRFSIIRAKDSSDIVEKELMHQQPLTDIEMEGSIAAKDAGMLEGSTLNVFFEMAGLSVIHAWFKSGFPLPRHTHDSDCLYYILAGSLKLGTEELGKGDGFFVGANVPYTYIAGDKGVELLEIRTSNAFDIKLLANNPDWWSKAVSSIEGRREAWKDERPPSLPA